MATKIVGTCALCLADNVELYLLRLEVDLNGQVFAQNATMIFLVVKQISLWQRRTP